MSHNYTILSTSANMIYFFCVKSISGFIISGAMIVLHPCMHA